MGYEHFLITAAPFASFSFTFSKLQKDVTIPSRSHSSPPPQEEWGKRGYHHHTLSVKLLMLSATIALQALPQPLRSNPSCATGHSPQLGAGTVLSEQSLFRCSCRLFDQLSAGQWPSWVRAISQTQIPTATQHQGIFIANNYINTG